MNLQPLFPDPILSQRAIPAAYADHTNNLWAVQTKNGQYIVRLPRPAAELQTPFWRGVQFLFGLDPTNPSRLATINRLLVQDSPLSIPQVVRSGQIAGRTAIVVEALPGNRLDDLRALPAASLAQLGEAVARLHQHHSSWFGTLDSSQHYPLHDWGARLAATLQLLASTSDDPTLHPPLAQFVAAALALPPLPFATPIMLDVDATQFLVADGAITGLVDTDAYAAGPPELELIGYEYELDTSSAAAFAAGYRRIRPLPDLTAVRPLYRYLCRLLETQGAVPLAEWFAWPAYLSHPA